MGPQLYRCGDSNTGNYPVTDTHPLQWGRNFIVAETNLEFQGLVVGVLLQWGRNFIVAET